jgi:hypothetical protein
LCDLAGEGFNLPLHTANCGSEFVTFFGELVSTSVRLLPGGTFRVEQFVEAADGADISIVHGAICCITGQELPQPQEACQ